MEKLKNDEAYTNGAEKCKWFAFTLLGAGTFTSNPFDFFCCCCSLFAQFNTRANFQLI